MTRAVLATPGFLFLCVLLLIWTGCGDDDPIDTSLVNEIDNNLTFTRPDSSDVAMGDEYAVCCAVWEPGTVDDVALKIFFYDTSQQLSFWKLFLVADDITVGESYSFPTEAGSPLRMFIFDARDQNELSSDDDASSGTITVEGLDCIPPVEIRISVDVVLGSEFHLGPPVSVSGTFRAVVYENPAAFGCGFSM